MRCVYNRRRIALEVSSLGSHATDLQQAKVLERQNTLTRKLEAWFSLQYLYMPHVALLRRAQGSLELSETTAHTQKLCLPSDLPPYLPCDPCLVHYEWRLRYAQAFEILDDLRNHLRLRTSLRSLSNRFARGVRHKTRARSVIDSAQQAIDVDTKRYQNTRAALVSLASRLPNTAGWDIHLQPLLDSDIRELQEAADGVSEGRRTLSWIWRVPGVGGPDDSDGIQEGGSFKRLLQTHAQVH